MLDHIADWYLQAGIEPGADTLPKHRNAIEQYRPNTTEIIAFARVFYGFITDEHHALAGFASALRTADPTLSTGRIKQLIAVVSGATLVSLLGRNDYPRYSDLAALSLVSGAVQGLRNALPVVEIPEIASKYIEQRTRTRASSPDRAADSPEGDARVAALERELSVVGEETNILWWLVSGFSRDQNAPWTTVGGLATPILAGKELADLTRAIPGPVSAAAFIDRVISPVVSARPKASKVKEAVEIRLKDAIDGIKRPWREHHAPKQFESGLEDLMPISNGLRLSLTVPEGADWSAAFENGTKLVRDAALRPTALAYQMYLECLLARAAKETGEGN
jgi:hypothetical protein